jgi:hypothetical protein
VDHPGSSGGAGSSGVQDLVEHLDQEWCVETSGSSDTQVLAESKGLECWESEVEVQDLVV